MARNRDQEQIESEPVADEAPVQEVVDEDPTRIVRMTHECSPGEYSEVPMASFLGVWQDKGWTLVEEATTET